MKKIIALLAVCGFALAFVSCGKKSEPAAEAYDSASVEEEVVDSASDMMMEEDTLATDTVGQ